MSILLFIIILAVLVLSHELGHFLVAKLFGIRVDEFGFGFPPKIFSWKYGETVYSINLLPLGGFVKIFGEDPTQEVLDTEHEDSKRCLYNKPRYIQAAVIGAGVLFNLILGWITLSAGFIAGLPVPVGFTDLGPRPEDSKLLITGVLKDSPAETAGLRSGYNIVYLAAKGSELKDLSPEKVSDFISTHGGQEIYVKYKVPTKTNLLVDIGLGPLDYGQDIRSASVIPKVGVIGARPGIGISMDLVGLLKLPFLDALHAGYLGVSALFMSTVRGLIHFVAGLFTGGSSVVSVSGPVGLIGIVGDAMGFGFAYLLALVTFISVNLAALNLAPFPALDGGRLFFLLIESIIRKPLNSKIVNALNIGGFIFLLGVMFVVTVGDIFKLVSY